MDDPNITMKEYIRLEEEKARRHGKVYNWETSTYGRIWCNEDVHDLRFVETEFPTIVFNDRLTSYDTLSCKSTVSSLKNNEIDFRISFDESDDEDYTVNIPLFPSPEPTVSCINDLDFFKEFENEFPAIIYNDALTSKSDFLTEPTVSPQHIDEFNLKDETSLSECDEEEQNVLYFNNLFPFNVIYPDYSKSDKDNGINTAYPGKDKLSTYLLTYVNENMNNGENLTNLEILNCWSLKTFNTASSNTYLSSIKSTLENLRANSQEFILIHNNLLRVGARILKSGFILTR
ncbi:hypothetical protein Tco_0209172 [Tanacetum coccineum]